MVINFNCKLNKTSIHPINSILRIESKVIWEIDESALREEYKALKVYRELAGISPVEFIHRYLTLEMNLSFDSIEFNENEIENLSKYLES